MESKLSSGIRLLQKRRIASFKELELISLSSSLLGSAKREERPGAAGMERGKREGDVELTEKVETSSFELCPLCFSSLSDYTAEPPMTSWENP